MGSKISRVCVVGAGSIGRRHLHVIRDFLPDARLALVSRSGQTSELADEHFRSTESALAFEPELCVIASSADLHIEDALVFANQGIDLLIEKPLSDQMNHVALLEHLAKEKSLVVAVGYTLRFLSALEYTKALLTEGNLKIGRILRIQVESSSYLPEWRKGNDYTSHVSAQKKRGGGAILELSHEFDYLVWLFGTLHLKSAFIQSRMGLEVEDFVQGVFVDQSNVPVQFTLDFFRRDPVRQLTLVGELGSIKVDLQKNEVWQISATTQTWVCLHHQSFDRNLVFKNQLSNVLESVATRSVPRVSLSQAIEVLKVCISVREQGVEN